MPARKNTDTPDPRSVTSLHVKIGLNIRKARLAAQITQEELGSMLGVSFQQVQKYEKGVNRVDTARMMDIAKALNVGMEEIVGTALKMKSNSAQDEFHALLATREGVQIIRAMYDLNPAQRQFVVDVAKRLPRLGAEA